jgi:hypothetical protein
MLIMQRSLIIAILIIVGAVAVSAWLAEHRGSEGTTITSPACGIYAAALAHIEQRYDEGSRTGPVSLIVVPAQPEFTEPLEAPLWSDWTPIGQARSDFSISATAFETFESLAPSGPLGCVFPDRPRWKDQSGTGWILEPDRNAGVSTYEFVEIHFSLPYQSTDGQRGMVVIQTETQGYTSFHWQHLVPAPQYLLLEKGQNGELWQVIAQSW